MFTFDLVILPARLGYFVRDLFILFDKCQGEQKEWSGQDGVILPRNIWLYNFTAVSDWRGGVLRTRGKCWGSIFDTSFTVWGSPGGGGGGGGESFTRLTLSCLQSEGRYRGDRTEQATPHHFPGTDGRHQGPQSVLTWRG